MSWEAAGQTLQDFMPILILLVFMLFLVRFLLRVSDVIVPKSDKSNFVTRLLRSIAITLPLALTVFIFNPMGLYAQSNSTAVSETISEVIAMFIPILIMIFLFVIFIAILQRVVRELNR